MIDGFFAEDLRKVESRVQDVFARQHDCVSLNADGTRCMLFSDGRFDNWCVYIVEQDMYGVWHAYAPGDRYYFERLYWFGTLTSYKLSLKKVYGHIVHIFDLMHSCPTTLSYEIVNEIDRICYTYYGDLHDMAFEVFMYIYFGMIAEENKEGTKLGRLVKAHGIHNLLCNQVPVELAADCTRGVKWNEILEECDSIGLVR